MARFIRRDKGVHPKVVKTLYSCGHQVIVAAGVTNQPSDKAQALPMVKEIESNTGLLPKELSADAGYFSASMPPRVFHTIGSVESAYDWSQQAEEDVTTEGALIIVTPQAQTNPTIVTENCI